MNRFWRVVCLFSSLLSGCAYQYQFPNIRVAKTEQESHAGAQAIILEAKDTLEYQTIDKKLMVVLTQYRQIKIYTKEGLKAAQVKLPFSHKYAIHYFAGRTLIQQEDDKQTVVFLDKSTAVTQRLKSAQEVGEVRFSLPRAQIGAVIDYVVIYHIEEPQLIEPLLVRGPYPTDRAEIRIIAPEGYAFKEQVIEEGQTKNVNAVPISDLPKDKHGVRYLWQQIPAIVEEEFAPALEYTGPTVYCALNTTPYHAKPFESWSDAVLFLSQYFGISNQINTSKTPDLDKIQNSLKAFLKNKLYHQTKLHTGDALALSENEAWSLGLSAYLTLKKEQHPVKLAFATQQKSEYAAPDLPTPGVFSRTLLAVQAGPVTHFLDPTCEACPLGYVSPHLEGAQVLLIDDKTKQLIQLKEHTFKDNAYLLNATWQLSFDAILSGDISAVSLGVPTAILKSSLQQQENIPSFMPHLLLSSQWKLIDQSLPKDFSLSQSLDFNFQAKTSCQKNESMRQIECRFDDILTDPLASVWRETRNQDVLLPFAFSFEVSSVIQMPHKSKFNVTPSTEYKSKHGQYVLQTKTDKDKALITRRLVIYQRRIPFAEYDEFFQFLTHIREFEKNTPFTTLKLKN